MKRHDPQLYVVAVAVLGMLLWLAHLSGRIASGEEVVTPWRYRYTHPKGAMCP